LGSVSERRLAPAREAFFVADSKEATKVPRTRPSHVLASLLFIISEAVRIIQYSSIPISNLHYYHPPF
jgi:hypothetical protein